jgi:hypothetical protein
LKRTRFTPGWPWTMNLPATPQTGETWVTVNETGVVRARRKTRIARRLDFGPLIAIHVRDERRRDIDARREVRELPPVPEEPEPPRVVDDGDPVPTPAPASGEVDEDPVPTPAPASGEVDDETPGAAGVDTVDGGDEMGSLGLGSVGTGSTGGGGSGTVGVDTVGVGRVGVGRGRLSASATPAKTPSTTSREARAADLIAEITSNAPFRVRGPPQSPECLR